MGLLELQGPQMLDGVLNTFGAPLMGLVGGFYNHAPSLFRGKEALKFYGTDQFRQGRVAWATTAAVVVGWNTFRALDRLTFQFLEKRDKNDAGLDIFNALAGGSGIVAILGGIRGINWTKQCLHFNWFIGTCGLLASIVHFFVTDNNGTNSKAGIAFAQSLTQLILPMIFALSPAIPKFVPPSTG